MAERSRSGDDTQTLAAWATPVRLPELRSTEAHVWVAWLSVPDDLVASLRGSLSLEEQSRAARFRFERDRRRYLISHGILRELLGGYADMEPVAVSYEIGTRGKPFLANQGGRGPIAFNMAHAGDMAIYVFSPKGPVGIDVEQVRPMEDALAIAEYQYSGTEREAVCAERTFMRDQIFFRIWVRKEAYIKAVGEGLSMSLTAFDTTAPPEIRGEVRGPDGGGAWVLRDLDPGPGWAAAVVTPDSVQDIRLWRWAPGIG